MYDSREDKKVEKAYSDMFFKNLLLYNEDGSNEETLRSTASLLTV